MERKVYVGLGSNLGDRQAMLAAARRGLAALGRLAECSSVYETAPWGVPDDQPMYLNQVCRLETEFRPGDLIARFQEIEVHLGRDRSRRLAARELDIDLLLYGDEVVETTAVTVPHPRLCERAFVVVPLAEIAPELVMPGMGQTVADILAGLDASGVWLWEGT